MKSLKPLLSVDEQIVHMKSKGISFEYMSEEEAKDFLLHRNYYMKLSAYRANYPKCPPGTPREGQYQNLDFAYLRELSTIDMHLRYYVLQMCLDIEHAIKVKLITSVTDDGIRDGEDGYKLVKEYFSKVDQRLDTLRSIRAHKAGEYCKDLIEKYYPYFPIWVLVEVISFGDLIHLCAYYDQSRNKDILIDGKFMNVIRDFRNASAHSNCLLNKAVAPMESSKQPDVRIAKFVQNISTIGKESRRKYLHITFCYNMVVLFYAYTHYMDPEIRKKRFAELRIFMEDRVARHKDYFSGNPRLCGIYRFMKKVVDNLCCD